MKCHFYSECNHPISLHCSTYYEGCQEYKRLIDLEVQRQSRLQRMTPLDRLRAFTGEDKDSIHKRESTKGLDAVNWEESQK